MGGETWIMRSVSTEHFRANNFDIMSIVIELNKKKLKKLVEQLFATETSCKSANSPEIHTSIGPYFK